MRLARWSSVLSRCRARNRSQRLLYIEQPLPRDLTFDNAARRTREEFRRHRRRGRAILRHLPECVRARLSRHFLEGLQGHLQVAAQRRARGQVVRGWHAHFPRGRRPHLSGRACACSRILALLALSRHRAFGAQRPSLCRRLCRHARGRGASVPDRPSRSVRGARRQHVRLAIRWRAIGSLAQSALLGVDPALIRSAATTFSPASAERQQMARFIF